MRLIRALDPSDVRRRQQSGNEHSSHPLVGGHGLQSSRNLPSTLHSAHSNHGLSAAHQYPSSHYDSVKVEEDYMVGLCLFHRMIPQRFSDPISRSRRRRNRPIA